MQVRKFLTATAVGGALAAASSAPLADDTVNLKFAYWLPTSHALHPGFVEWTESITEASGGSIQFTHFPAQQLGPAKDHYSMTKLGIADVGFINPGYTPGQFPVIAGAELPFLFSNATGGSRALDEWYRKHNKKEMRDVHYCMAFIHDPGTIHSKEPVTSPEDLQGVKVRPANATMARYINELGGASVHVAIPEARDALAKGVVDAVMTPWDGLTVWGMEKIVKNHTDMPVYATNFIIPINTSTYRKLSDAQKQVIDKHCTPEWAEKVATNWAHREEAGRAKVAKLPGHELHKPSADEMAAWQQAAEPVKAQWANSVKRQGQDPDAIYQDLVQTLRKHDAYYGTE